MPGRRSADDAAAEALAKKLAPYRHDGSAKRFDLAAVDPRATPFATGGGKLRDKALVERLAIEIDELQNLFFADRRFKLLVVLQGTDTSGKDGTLRAVFGRTSPLGVGTVSWQAPSAAERAHDFLWRIHQRVPAAGEITVFNRSHYEDVLVPVVEGSIDAAEAKRRLAHINAFERLLAETGTVICKFMLHISKEEQRERLQARLDDPAKRWKFRREDLDARERWDAYQAAYARTIDATGTAWAPWTVVPADSKTHRNLMIATSLKATLAGLGLRTPPDDPELAGLTVE